ncbi:MAG: bifunctional alpha,alpha-trehalose-phosphate synthase (UDP-forming)/trehalose-phosphatase [Myxococcota bacterium]
MSNPPDSGRLIVLSNRLPITLERRRGRLVANRSSGGLVAALEPAMRERGGTWIGWPGAGLKANESLPSPSEGYALEPVALTPTEIRRFYHGFSNATLWPLFHSFLERTALDPRDWTVYERVNARFAEAASACMQEGDLVWVHDYHLTRCPHQLRLLRPDARIAFFMHIPFPPFDVYRILPWYREVIRGLLACDLIGFHSPGYVSNFLDCVERLLGERVDRETGRIEHGDRTVRVGAFPLGIDYEAYASRARSAARPATAVGEQIILGVDRLDYTKGIPERMRAYERMLELHREHRGRVVLIQVAVPTREQVTEYQRLKREIDELVGRINGRFGTSQWTPVRYIHRSISHERLCALYRDADVGLVTPLRDGMNLVAKEFVASQVDEPGVLVLSRLAGAADTMQEAILVNPYNIDSVADAIHRALTLPADEREARLRALQRRERQNDLHAWLAGFLEAASSSEAGIEPVRVEDFDALLGEFLDGRPLMLFLDYDGTLASIAAHPSEAGLGTSMRRALEACAERSDTQVTIVSGRSLADVRACVPIEGISFAGNHGLEIEGPDVPFYRHPDIAHYVERAVELTRQLEAIAIPGVWVEAKGASLTLHFRQASPTHHATIAAQRARSCARPASRRATRSVPSRRGRRSAGTRATPCCTCCARRAARPGRGRPHALRRRRRDGRGRVPRARRPRRDLRVGPAEQPTRARWRLSNVDAVETLLRWIAAGPARTPLA